MDQLVRLHMTIAGQSLLQKLELRDGTRVTNILHMLREELPGLSRIPSSTWSQQPSWLRLSMELVEHILGIQGKGKITDYVARTLSEDRKSVV